MIFLVKLIILAIVFNGVFIGIDWWRQKKKIPLLSNTPTNYLLSSLFLMLGICAIGLDMFLVVSLIMVPFGL